MLEERLMLEFTRGTPVLLCRLSTTTPVRAHMRFPQQQPEMAPWPAGMPETPQKPPLSS